MSASRPSTSTPVEKPFLHRQRRTPVARALTILLAAGSAAGAVQAQQAFSAAWMANKNIVQGTAMATGRLPNGMSASSLTSPLAQQQQSRQQLQRSINNLNLAAQAIAAQQAWQAGQRQIAQDNDPSVPDGLADGGLQVDTNSLTAGWLNANAPTQTVADGQTTVSIQQTGAKAILNWQTFNVGKNTSVQFVQQPTWAVLNRVNDPLARPSQIQGQIHGDGTVLIVNRNGVVFTGTAQIDTRNLVAAAANIDDSQFNARGIYGADANTPTFTDALGRVDVKAGAQITTREPNSATQGGGYALLLGAQVGNAGQITTHQGQAELAAGDSFIIRRGVGTDANQPSTTRGNEISPQFVANSSAGQVVNSGLITAREGDITLAGRDVQQNGVAVSSTTVDTRGTIHLLNSASDTLGKVTLGEGATTAVVIEDDGHTALDSQRDQLIADSVTQDALRAGTSRNTFDNLSLLSDRRDQSRIEIVSGGDVDFDAGSLTLATSGQIAVSATRRSFVADKAQLDVSGAVGASLSMESNNVKVNIQGNEQRDAPANRDSGNLLNANVWIDRRQLIYVPAGTGGYTGDRWYTSSGLLEVGGYLGTEGHGIGEWAAEGGSVVLGGKEVITQAGSSVNLSGGSLDVATGYLNQTWLKGSDGHLYNINSAPSDMVFTGIYKGFEDTHQRWGDTTTGYFYSPLIGPQRVLQNGYTVGRDAGQLIVSAPTAVLEGDVVATVYNGPQQTQAHAAGMADGYKQSQNAVAQAGGLVLGAYSGPGRTDVFASDVRIDDVAGITAGMASGDALDDARLNTVWLDAGLLDSQKLGVLDLATSGQITVKKALTLDNGGRLNLVAPVVEVDAGITVRSGSVSIGNFLTFDGTTTSTALTTPGDNGSSLTLGAGASIDARGLWTNALLDPLHQAGLAYVDGGDVSFDSTQNVILAEGSAIDVSSGGAVLINGKTRGGTGGNVSLIAGHPFGSLTAVGALTLDGAIRAVGVKGGGTLKLSTPGNFLVGDNASLAGGELPAGTAAPVSVTLAQDMVIPAGQPLPYAQINNYSALLPGMPAPFVLQSIARVLNITTHADWTVPSGFGIWVDLGGGNLSLFQGGSVLPAGSLISSTFGTIPAGTVIDASVLPDGLPTTPYKVIKNAGTVQATATTYLAGSAIPIGAVLPQTVAVVPTPSLSPSFFSAGFANYDLNAATGVLVANGTALAPTMPVYMFTPASLAAASGSDPATAMQQWLPPVFLENPQDGTLTPRGGASLALRSTTSTLSVASGGSVVVGPGASITVDPGQSITLDAFDQLTVDGRLVAHGGSISLLSEAAGLSEPSRNFDLSGVGRGRSIWIGDDAQLDVSGLAQGALDAYGRPYGQLTNGGAISLSAGQAFVIIRPGAELDADGAALTIDPAAGTVGSRSGGAQTLASNGGSISLSAGSGIYMDGNLHAFAGGAGAAGGSLSVKLVTPQFPGDGTVPASEIVSSVLTVTQSRPDALPAALAAGTDDAALKNGQATVSADAVKAGGFDSLSLYSDDYIQFSGDVALTLGQSLTLTAGAYTSGPALAARPDPSTWVPPSGSVRLSAPYVLLRASQPTIPDAITSGNIRNPQASGLPTDARFELDADQLDIQGPVVFSAAARGTYSPGFASTRLVSSGDIRFLATNGTQQTALGTDWDLDFVAAQVYPATNNNVIVTAGQGNSDYAATLRIERADGPVPDQPMSVFGHLTLNAPIIEQGGVLRAPLGGISLGADGMSQRIELLPGSITSVSGAGLTLPYGGTIDGITYNYAGKAVQPSSFSLDVFQQVSTGVLLNSQSIDVQQGATLDLSGGGTLTGAGFVSGRGGSVNVLNTPLINANPATPLSRAGDKVYAIVPSYRAGYAPVAPENGAGDPAIGQQITIPAGVPGLAAGTYTLLPSNYALLPGAFRVELGSTVPVPLAGATTIGNGTYMTTGTTGVANTAIHSALPQTLLITPAAAVRSDSQFDEQGYSDFLLANATQFGGTRPVLPSDGKVLKLTFQTPSASPDSGEVPPSLRFDGRALFQGQGDGFAGQAVVGGGNNLEVYADAPTAGFDGISLDARDLNAIAAPRLTLGGVEYLNQPPGAVVGFIANDSGVFVRDNVTLKAGELFLVAGGADGVNIGKGATLSTIGAGAPPFDSSDGYTYSAGNNTVLALSNGDLQFVGSTGGSGSITIEAGASLYSEGTLVFATNGRSNIDPAAHFGSRNIALAVGAINLGSTADIAAAGAPAGMQFNQALFDFLIHGDPLHGAPALERLTFSAGNSFNLFGNATLDASGTGVNLVFNTPALYGWGAAGDHATIAAGTLTWNGVVGATPPAILAGGAGTGSGTLELKADDIVFGKFISMDTTTTSRTLYGFGDVNLIANHSITAAGNSSLSVFQAPSTVAGDVFGQSGTGGNLNLVTPLLTGLSRSLMSYVAGGALGVSAPEGFAPSTAHSTVAGAEIDLTGDSVAIASTIQLPSGKLVVDAAHDIDLNAGGRIDLSGQPSQIQSATVYGFGGDLILDSTDGNVNQAAGSTIDVSATQAHAGSITANAAHGNLSLAGALLGSATEGQASGDFSATAATFSDFAGLNAALTQGGVFDARSFDLKSGDLTIGDGVKARNVTVSVDNGSLTVSGTIDASGAAPGSIRLSAMNALTLASSAVLDTHGTVLQTDSYGAPVEAKNRGHVELAASTGLLTLAPGATMDLSAPDGVARGQVELNASRTGETSGDIRIDASGPLNIQGAQSIAVNGFWKYSPTDTYGTIVQDNGGTDPVSAATGYLGMNQVDARNQDFINAALANGDLRGRLAGLASYANAFHLRPGVEIDSATPDGTLTIAGDIDLAGLRYASLNANFQKTGVYGSGEPGALVIRAGGDLDVVGSLSDGFMPAPATPDDNGWLLQAGAQANSLETLLPLVLNAGTTMPNTAGLALRYDIPIQAAAIRANAVIPAQVTLSSDYTVPAGTRLTGAVYDGTGNLLYAAGSVLAVATTLPAGSQLGVNSTMPGSVAIAAMTWPQGASLGVFTSAVTLSASATVPFEGVIPGGANVQLSSDTVPTRPTGSGGAQGSITAIAAMLPEGSLSWSIRGVAGADLDAADTRTVRSTSALKASGTSGNLTLSDGHKGSIAQAHYYLYSASGTKYGPYLGTTGYWCTGHGYTCAPAPSTFAVGKNAPSTLRTGTGNLELIAGGSFSEDSLFGVYTAGTQSAPALAADGSNPYNLPRGLQDDGTLLGAVNSGKEAAAQAAYQAWYPEHGGDVLVSAQRNLSGSIAMASAPDTFVDSDENGNWLWRQGGGGVTADPAAWSINFGTYARTSSLSDGPDAVLVGFQGIGTLGGGNLTVVAGGNAGVMDLNASTGLNLAVASTGRVLADGTLLQTGGGDLTLKIGGTLNPAAPVNTPKPGDYYGVLTDLRGDISVDAGAVGSVALTVMGASFTSLDPRSLDPSVLKRSMKTPGPLVTPGDGSVSISTRGDLVLGGATDAGMADPISTIGNAYTLRNPDGSTSLVAEGGGVSRFMLWTPATSIALYSAGGDVAPLTGSSTDDLAFYPGTLTVAAANGDIRFAEPASAFQNFTVLELAPSPTGQLALLAAGSIYGSTQTVAMSGASMSSLATPVHPFFSGADGLTNASIDTARLATFFQANPIAFGEDTPGENLHAGDSQPAQVFAGVDIDDLNLGVIRRANTNNVDFFPGDNTWYIAAKPFEVIAGRDIVGTGATPDVFFNNGANDISVIRAGRDIIYQSADIAGPGLLDVEAGRKLYQGYRGTLESVGPLFDVNAANRSGGAGITVQAGVGAAGPDYADFAKLYFNAANALPSGTALAGSGKVVHAYDQELLAWLQQRFGYAGSSADALAYFLALPSEQQGVFVRQVYYTELTAGGREYNDASSARFGSYLRGRDAIAALFPTQDAQGQAIAYGGGITMFSSNATSGTGAAVIADGGVRTDFGGDIQVLNPGGQTIIGVEGVKPGPGAGLITQGSGDIDIYSEGSILLGLSRIMTTFGGSILGWSATGDINAGRGSKTTLVYTPPRRVYDDTGNVTLSPNVPSSGAGIATLAPLPEVPPGDVDLIAPLGTIDAGEAGIRVSGNVNLAALQVVNAANIQVQGKSTGLPVVASVNVGALTSASAAASQAAIAAQDEVQRERTAARQALPSIFTVRVLGFGSDDSASAPAAAPDAQGKQARNDPLAAIQVVGDGALTETQSAMLTPAERRNWRP